MRSIARRVSRPRSLSRRHSRTGFTLVELLVVISIILLVSIVAIPVINNSLSGRQVTDAARIFSGSLVGIRDSAIRYNEPRGIRLLPDPVLTIPPPGQANSGTTQLCYNRMIAIELAGDYSEGRVTIGPQFPVTASGAMTQTGFPPRYAFADMMNVAAATYPFPNSSGTPDVLMVEASPFKGGYVSTGEPNSPTNWYWTVRVGDKIKIGGAGRTYTIVGPCTVNPWVTGVNNGNPEMFVNVGPPGTEVPLLRDYYNGPTTFTPATKDRPEFLFLVNGEDDDKDGYADEGFDGYNNNLLLPPPGPGEFIGGRLPTDNIYTDEPFEWEREKWVGTPATVQLLDNMTTDITRTPSQVWAAANYQKGVQDAEYTILRRPVPSEGAREVMLPAGMVIDATTWNSTTRERSRIPVEPGSLYVDILVNPSGSFIPTTQYSSQASAPKLPFLHFWLTSREDVHPIGTIPTALGLPYQLPMTPDALALDTTNPGFDLPGPGNYPPSSSPALPVLKGDRRLVTMFTQSGLVVTNTVESIPRIYSAAAPIVAGEGFNVGDLNYPYLKAQQGLREPR